VWSAAQTGESPPPGSHLTHSTHLTDLSMIDIAFENCRLCCDYNQKANATDKDSLMLTLPWCEKGLFRYYSQKSHE